MLTNTRVEFKSTNPSLSHILITNYQSMAVSRLQLSNAVGGGPINPSRSYSAVLNASMKSKVWMEWCITHAVDGFERIDGGNEERMLVVVLHSELKANGG